MVVGNISNGDNKSHQGFEFPFPIFWFLGTRNFLSIWLRVLLVESDVLSEFSYSAGTGVTYHDSAELLNYSCSCNMVLHRRSKLKSRLDSYIM